MSALGTPHLHLRATDSTNDRARGLALAGAPHGTLVTAAEQSAGRGRQGRSWSAPAGSSLLMSIVLRNPPDLLPLAAGVAVARVCGEGARIKWPNDVLLDDRKVAGILAEARLQERWAVLGIGLNVAVDLRDLPAELQGTAATLGGTPADIPLVRDRLLRELEVALALDDATLLSTYRAADALLGRAISWSGGSGTAAGIDGSGRLVVDLADGGRTALNSGEVHLGPRG